MSAACQDELFNINNEAKQTHSSKYWDLCSEIKKKYLNYGII